MSEFEGLLSKGTNSQSDEKRKPADIFDAREDLIAQGLKFICVHTVLRRESMKFTITQWKLPGD